ncbi:response regulator transcription factor [Janibacter indicus]|uniref:DNA-binding response regulator, OmpR family, contains REC and winged-helix (WHTH) domain n=1 Tax=Janibacter indicus TaxID=857417 RepID=A0A1W2CSS3_9MICO|nr:response regulator transcription factor [Janibacter indicus]SMC87932.1 DNA-binding response regulator, OmpR family, contains REC and winged-helix (wHTH) domain [Janibacter indicus]
MRVLLVEDDDRVVAALTPALRRAHLTVIRAGTAAEAVEAAPGADLVLLDMGLPDQDGLTVCRRIRERDGVPIIAVTARRDEASVVSALRAGVDDYVTKPYRLAELMARIDAVMRRSGHGVPESIDHVADVRLDLGARRVWAGETEVALTRKEFDLLSTLVDADGDAVSRESLMESIWDTSWVGASRTLDVHVSALRTKLGRPQLIETVRGIGYRINPGG